MVGLPTLPMVAKRPKLEMASRNRSMRFPARSTVRVDRPVMLPPGRARLVTRPTPTGSPTVANTIGTTGVTCFAAITAGAPPVTIMLTLSRTNSAAISAKFRPAIFDRDSATLNPAELPEALRECGRSLTFAQGCALTQKADGRRLPRLLRLRRERPSRYRAAECGQQFPPSDGDCHAPLPCEGA